MGGGGRGRMEYPTLPELRAEGRSALVGKSESLSPLPATRDFLKAKGTPPGGGMQPSRSLGTSRQPFPPPPSSGIPHRPVFIQKILSVVDGGGGASQQPFSSQPPFLPSEARPLPRGR